MKVEIWSDFVCPFCYIGKRRFEHALEKFSYRDQVTVQFRSYQLDPAAQHIPGKNYAETFSELKGISLEQVSVMNKQVGDQAEEVGLTYNFETMKYSNTFDAHRLAKLAAENEKEAELTERLFQAHFLDSDLLSDKNTLIRLAEEIGLNREDAETVLESCKFRNKVNEDIDLAKQLGVQGVPFFVFNEKYAVSGAQPEETFTQVLEKVWQEEQEKPKPVLQSLNPNENKTSYCTGDGCENK
ncbi:DsbA family oxidoreductase [Oceanobacillus neutriphilus]|uniref:DSBA oxidoreductase n=1 Tax=Oceanobacillus neutriphilus TaxID=531815 RepID=A0ABQ2P0G0_9BACI|nr:DsbA family oxidoreductase [Oceanobacillus neutriphilus]GGP14963.1 DSBA oxidoreductase [Oceanobacillus neutriphilus]